MGHITLKLLFRVLQVNISLKKILLYSILSSQRSFEIMRILLVEDDPLLGDGVRAGLAYYGHAVDWLKDGQSALHALKYEKFDIIVLDLGLPKLSGLDLLEIIRKDGIETPVLILTARDTTQDRVKGLDKGADDYLTKPFDLDELCARIRALQRRFAARATPHHYLQ